MPDSLTAETFIDTDEEVATSIQSLPSDEELLHEFTIENTSNKDVEMIDDESDETESTEKEQPSKKALFEAMDLIESFTLFQNDDIAMQMRKCTAQLNELIASSSRKKQSTITSFFNPTVTNYFSREKVAKSVYSVFFINTPLCSELFYFLNPPFFELFCQSSKNWG